MFGPDGAAWRMWFAVFFCCCGREASLAPPPPLPQPLESATVRPAASPVVSAMAGTAGATPPPWLELVRDAQWDAAWHVLDELPNADRERPEIRYVRARVALERGDAAGALPPLEDLEVALPLLASDIDRRRAEAKSVAGPFAEAGEWYAAHLTPQAQIEAARAFEKAGDPRRARAAADRALAFDKKTRAQEAEARALRVRIAAPATDVERADVRWLATVGADLPAAEEALTLLSKVDSTRPLTAPELLVRARAFADAGRTDDAVHAVDLSAHANGGSVTRAERLHVRGMALFRARGRGAEASRVLAEAAAAGGPTAAEDAFHAARALSRVDRDEEAIAGYEGVARRYPKSPWADQATYFAPYLRMLHGDWHECARGFDAYVHAFPHGEAIHDARSGGALCKLLDGQYKAARAEYEHLVEDEPDPTVSARMANMAALAALRDGDRTHAVARWVDVARSRPLSWPALVARARLADLGVPVLDANDALDSGTSNAPEPLSVAMPAPAGLLEQLGLEADAESALRDREPAIASAAGPRASEALCAAYAHIGRARRRYQIAQTLPSALFTSEPAASTRWAWECAFPSPYAEAVHAAEASEHLPRGLLWAVMRQESAFDPEAVSAAHAVGLMQLLPETARPIADELGLPHEDARLTRPSYSIRVGARALRRLIDEFQGAVALAVAAYNCGAESVERWATRAPGMTLDTFVERIPYKETREYVI
ncbi:MAG: lytic transglycosylase domain-containing protein, partial [Polyangiaceae bacterium]|nr:lytic transglycosylase domain-containing protein [Polyangiaceae bacterium]